MLPSNILLSISHNSRFLLFQHFFYHCNFTNSFVSSYYQYPANAYDFSEVYFFERSDHLNTQHSWNSNRVSSLPQCQNCLIVRLWPGVDFIKIEGWSFFIEIALAIYYGKYISLFISPLSTHCELHVIGSHLNQSTELYNKYWQIWVAARDSSSISQVKLESSQAFKSRYSPQSFCPWDQSISRQISRRIMDKLWIKVRTNRQIILLKFILFNLSYLLFTCLSTSTVFISS